MRGQEGGLAKGGQGRYPADMLKTCGAAIAACVVVSSLVATAPGQVTSGSVLADRPNGPKRAAVSHHILLNATVHPEPGVVWERGYVEIRDGRIVSASELAAGEPPEDFPGAVVHDLTGEHVYAAFVDPYVEIETPRPGSDRPGAHWNGAVMPWRSVLDGDGITSGTAESRRKLGYGAAVIVPEGGVFAGSAAAVSLAEHDADRSAERVEVYKDGVYQALDFETRGWSSRSYPTSTPGAVALMRQTLIDADWQAESGPTLDGSNPRNAISPLEDGSVPLVFDCAHELEHFLAADIAGEFSRPAVIMGNGMEFKWLDGIAGLGLDLIVPLRFPSKPDVTSVGSADSVELETMMAWEQAPTNPRRLVEAATDSTLALTASALPKGRKFHGEIRRAIENGLGEADALAMLTTGPARIAGIADQVGTIGDGMRANLLVASGPVFEKETELRDVWIDGRRHVLSDRPDAGMDGVWRAWVGDEAEPVFEMTLEISGTGPDSGKKKPKVVGTESWSADAAEGQEAEPHSSDARKVSVVGGRVSFLLDDTDDEGGTYIMSATLAGDGVMIGSAIAMDDSVFGWKARRTGDAAADEDGGEDKDEKEEDDSDDDGFEQAPPLPGYPFGPYAVRFEPAQETILFTNATIWTGTDRGTMENGWLLMGGGKIYRFEPGPAPEWMLDGSNDEVVVVDVGGKHITPGLIDAHSHTSLFRFGVNESGQAVSAEVRIGDSLDPGHINWYRQLAMGVTTVNSLHGSSNPIGGQNALHKIRWGSKTPDGFAVVGGRPGIKFALGENVKQSNWNLRSSERTRYPQTRMGVETVIRDRFEAAREYAEAFEAGEVRRDLELEALAEILAGERLIHCHSYRQDEILMLCRVAEDFGFKIGSFQHGLEVYKVAEAVREHAIGASLFSDWWMYKVEVMDAIPFAGPLQTEAGVMTSYNSDSDELSRRMNLEAAKALKYARPGTMNDAEALKFVTANPAQQIGAGSTGRIEEGLDADLVVWSHHPLSTRAVAERVYIEGREYFSLEQDRLHRERIASERQRLIRKIVESPGLLEEGEGADEPEGDAPMVDSPPDRLAEDRAWFGRRGVVTDWMRSGFHPDDMRPGDCGCGIINHAIYYESMER